MRLPGCYCLHPPSSNKTASPIFYHLTLLVPMTHAELCCLLTIYSEDTAAAAAATTALPLFVAENHKQVISYANNWH